MNSVDRSRPDQTRGAFREIFRWRAGLFLFAGLIAAMVVVAAVSADQGTVLSVLIVTCVWASAAIAWNILAGFGGQLSFGHAAFFGVGAYSMAILYTDHGVSPWVGTLIGGVAAALLGIAVGLPTFRLRGPYFALATLALAEAFRRLAVWKVDFTGGADGTPLSIKHGFENMYWAGTRPFAWVAIGLLIVSFLVSAVVRFSRFGFFLRAIRDDEDAASAAGVNPLAIKLGAIVVSAFLTGIAGAVLARYLSIAAPEDFLGVHVSTQLLLVTFVGGLGTLAGPVVGTLVIVPGEYALRLTLGSQTAGGLYALFYGLSLILVVLFYSRGLAPGAVEVFQRLRRRFGGGHEVGGDEPDDHPPDEPPPAARETPAPALVPSASGDH